jgi:hypothetical protein
MYTFSIFKEGCQEGCKEECKEECHRLKYSTLREAIEKLRRQVKYLKNVSLYSPKREIFEDYNDGYFIIHNETNNTQETFSFDRNNIIQDSNGEIMNSFKNDFLRKYNYPLEIYDKDNEDYEEDLKYKVTQLDRQQIANITVYYGGDLNVHNHEIVFRTKRELITHLFDIEDRRNIHYWIQIYPRSSYWETYQIDFDNYKIKINYKGEEIIFSLNVKKSFSFFDSDYNEMSMEDFLTKFYIDDTEYYTIEDYIEQRDRFIFILTEHLHEKEREFRGNDGVWGDYGHFDDLLQWHYQFCYGPDA